MKRHSEEVGLRFQETNLDIWISLPQNNIFYSNKINVFLSALTQKVAPNWRMFHGGLMCGKPLCAICYV